MSRPMMAPILVLGLGLSLAIGCHVRSTVDDTGDTGPDLGSVRNKPGTITISPNPINVVVNGAAQAIKLNARSSTYGDVTRTATWSVSDPTVGGVQGGVLNVSGALDHGGQATIVASYGIQTGSAQLNVKLIAPDLVDPSAPAGAGNYFTGPEGGAKPAVVYPLAGTMFPRNHPQMDFQWSAVGGAQAYRIFVDSPTFAQSMYVGTSVCAGAGCQFNMPDDKWALLARSVAGADAQLTISASTGPGAMIGSTAPQTMSFSPEDVKGGLYYWSTTITGTYRVPLGAKTAQVFINRGNEFGCCGCHAVSRDGKKVALEFGSADGVGGGVVDGTDGTKYLIGPAGAKGNPPRAGQWNLQTFSPKGDMLLVNWMQQGRVIDSTTGQAVPGVSPFPERMAQPEWSPDGQNIVYLRYPADGSGDEWNASNVGDLTIIPWNGGKWGAAQVIVQSKPGVEYYFYPTWTPDSQWIIYNKGTVPCGGLGGGGCGNYDAVNTSLWMVQAQPGAKPIALKNATFKTMSSTNWPRVAPFIQKNGSLIFFTFSANFAYGYVKTGNNPQIWMAAVDLQKAMMQPDQDPSYAPFWLTFQKTGENNHLGTWTSDVACVDDTQCPSEFMCVAGMCVARNPG